MTRHPLLLAVLTSDTLGFLLLLGASITAFRITLHWDPQDTGSRQLRLQALSETTAAAIVWAFGLYVFTTVGLVYAITNILPDLVPGAMCGTGVLQAMRSGGPRMLIYRFVALSLFWTWWRLEKVNRALPEAPLTSFNARCVLLLLPACALALHASWQALTAMEYQQPVDCCAIIYDQFHSLGDARRTMGVGNTAWVGAFGVLTLAMTAVAWAVWKGRRRRWLSLLLTCLAIGWLLVAAIALVRSFAAYHYGVLHHYCPWCLFLPEHRLAGFPLWTAWLFVALEVPAILVMSTRVVSGLPAVAPVVEGESRKAARRVLLAIMIFVLLAVGPAVWWRLQFGMWLTG